MATVEGMKKQIQKSSGTIGCEKCISQVDWQDWEEKDANEEF